MDPARVPALFYIVSPSTPDGEQYYMATWTGISGDRFYRNAPGADFTTFSDEWVNANIRAKGPLGKLYPKPCCIHEGDTPSFLGLIDNGLDSAMSPAWGGWGGRYVWRQPAGEPRAVWTQGGDSYPGNDNSRDTVVGVDGEAVHVGSGDDLALADGVSARLRRAYVMDRRCAAREPQPRRRRERERRQGAVTIDATVGTPVTLDTSATRDPDGNALTYSWFYYAEAGTGIPGHPVYEGGSAPPSRPAPAGFRHPPKGARPSPHRASRSIASTRRVSS